MKLLHIFIVIYNVADYSTVLDSDQVTAPSKEFSVFPNPVRESAVSFKTRESREEIEVNIYNIRGQLVKKTSDFKAINGERHFVWNRSDERGQEVSSGIYFYRIISDNETLTGKFLILK